MFKRDVVFWLGITCLIVYIIDFIYTVFYLQRPYSLLWYSNFGLLATAIALLSRNSRFFFSIFCTLFVVESIWAFGFIGSVLFQAPLPGVYEYAFQDGHLKQESYLTIYHILIPIALAVGLIKFKKIYHSGWVGAVIYASLLLMATYFLVDPIHNTNCVHDLDYCGKLAPFLTQITTLPRLMIYIVFLTLTVFIPTNIATIMLAKKLKLEVS